MLPDGRRLGAHLPLGGGMVKAVDGPTRSAPRRSRSSATTRPPGSGAPTPPKDQPAFRERLTELDIRPGGDPRRLPREPGRRDRRTSTSARSRSSPTTWRARPGSRPASSTSTPARIEEPARRPGRPASPTACAAVLAARRATTPDAPMLVLENSAGGGDSMGSTVEELADIAEAIAACNVPSPTRRLLHRRRARLGRGLPDLGAGRGRRADRSLRCADRARPAGDGPPERHPVRRSARGPTGTSTSGPARSARRACAGC